MKFCFQLITHVLTNEFLSFDQFLFLTLLNLFLIVIHFLLIQYEMRLLLVKVMDIKVLQLKEFNHFRQVLDVLFSRNLRFFYWHYDFSLLLSKILTIKSS